MKSGLKKVLLKKSDGAVGVMVHALLILITIIIVTVVITKVIFVRNESVDIDSIVNSALKESCISNIDYKAAANNSSNGKIRDVQKLSKDFRTRIKEHLGLTTALNDNQYKASLVIGEAPAGNDTLKGTVSVKTFKVYTYNESIGKYDEITLDASGNSSVTGSASEYVLSNGMRISAARDRNTCVYVKLNLKVKGYFGTEASPEKEFCYTIGQVDGNVSSSENLKGYNAMHKYSDRADFR